MFVKGFEKYSRSEAEIRAELAAVFAGCGEVVQVRIPTDRATGEVKGFAFVEFASAEAKASAAELDGNAKCGGRWLRIDGNTATDGRSGVGGADGGSYLRAAPSPAPGAETAPGAPPGESGSLFRRTPSRRQRPAGSGRFSGERAAQQESGGSGARAGSRSPRKGPSRLRLRGAPTGRAQALRELLRVNVEGAYAGLVSGPADPVAEAVDATGDSSAERGGSEEQRGGSAGAMRTGLDARERRFVTELVSGVTRWRRRLDFQIEAVSNRTGPLDPEVQEIMRLGVFELLILQKPPHVASAYVDLARAASGEGVAKFVNGMLRSIARHRDAGTLPKLRPPPSGHTPTGAEDVRKIADTLGVQFSHPTWMVERWLRRFGLEECVELLMCNNRRPTYALRPNSQRGYDVHRLRTRLREAATATATVEVGGASLELESSEVFPDDFLRVKRGLQQAYRSGLLQDGKAVVQDESAGLVVALLDPQPGDRILDGCAAPGGKTFFTAARLHGRGSVLALDVSPRRLQALENQAERLGLSGLVSTRAVDFREFRESLGAEEGPQIFDRVLVDAPCSGLGVLAKRADLRWRRTAEEILELQSLQDELLAAAAPLVRVGGHLVYSTCSIEPDENEERVERFLEAHPGFELEPAGAKLDEGVLSADGRFLATLPHRHGTDGAFGALLRRRG